MKADLKKQLLNHLANGVKKARKQQDGKTGKFLAPNGGWAVTLQDVIFPMAVLYTHKGTEWYAKTSLLQTIIKGGNALRDEQDAKGQWEFVKPDGSRWGKTYMPWSIYHWAETYALVKDDLDKNTRESWKKGLTLCYNGLAKNYKQPVAHNIPTWDGMSLVRGSQIFNRPDWAEVGTAQCRFSAAHQCKDGYWPEGDGPTNGYNTIYVHALGLYYAFTADKAVYKSLQRACGFHSTFTYPDGSCVETIDGRQKYSAAPRPSGWPGLSIFPEGRRLVSLIAQSIIGQNKGGLLPHIAAFILHGKTGNEKALPWEDQERVIYAKKAMIRRVGPWFATVSGFSTPADSRTINGRNRWIMTRSNCLSVWHEKLGLLIGGGNSKHDPFFSTFDVGDEGARRLEADAISFKETAKGETVRFRYGKHVCLLHLHWKSKKALELTFELPPATRKHAVVQAGFTMKLKAGSKLSWEGEAETPYRGSSKLDPQRTTYVDWGEPGYYKARVIKGDGWTLEMPDESTLHWPTYPFNPYAIDNAAAPADAIAAVSAGFAESNTRTFRLTIP